MTIDAGVLPLREALDRVAAAGRFRLSYSAEVLPLDRAACLNVRDLPAGTALAALLHDTGVVPLVVSEALVVLPPPPGSSAPRRRPPRRRWSSRPSW